VHDADDAADRDDDRGGLVDLDVMAAVGNNEIGAAG
jgi:hypothetical protein